MNGSDRASTPDGTRRAPLVSRRTVLRGIAVAAVMPTVILHTERPARAQAAGPPPAPPSLLPRRDHTAVAMGDGSVLVAGGFYNGALSDAQIFRGGQWVAAAPMRTPRYEHAAVAMGDGSVIVLGGLYHGPMADVEMYDPASDSWTPLAPMALPRHGHAAVAMGGSILITGGFYNGVLDEPEIYALQG